MIKKTVIVLLALMVLAGLLVTITVYNLPAFLSYAINRATGIGVRMEKAEVSFKDGTIAVSLGNLRFKGPVSGKIGQLSAGVYLSRGLAFDRLAVKDFDLAIGEIKMGKKPIKTRIGLLEISNGVVTATGRKLVIGSIVAQNINNKKPFQFVASITDPDHAGKVRVVGNGTIGKDNKQTVKGSIEVDAFGLEKIDRIMKGVVNGKGDFTFRDNELTLIGKCISPRLVIMDTWLKKAIIAEKVTANSTIRSKKGVITIALYDTGFRGTPFTVDIYLTEWVFSKLEIKSGDIPMSVVREHLKVDEIGYDVWTYIKDGFLKMKSLAYEKDKPIMAELHLKDMTGDYEGKKITAISGILMMEDAKGTFSDGKGTYKASTFSNFKGTINLGKKPSVKLTGDYTIDLQHISDFVDLKDVAVNKGTAGGTIEVDSTGKGLRLGGSGKVSGAEVVWRRHTFAVSGPFSLKGQEMSFNSVSLAGKETSLALNGTWGSSGFSAYAKGHIDAALLEGLTEKPLRMTGRAVVDAHVMVAKGNLGTNGQIIMDDVAYAIPGFLNKPKGVPSRAQARFTRKKTGEIIVDDFSGNLDVINIKASGSITSEGKIDSKVSARAKDWGRAAPLFLISEDIKGGDVAIDLTVKDLSFPMQKLPWVVGTASMKKGFLKVPGVPKVMKNIDLNADFRGHEFDASVSGLTTGASVLKKASLKVKGFDHPKFDLVVTMDRINTADFKSDKEFAISSMKKDGVLALSSGNISIRSKDVSLGSVPAKDLEINAFMTDRKVNVSDLKLRVFDGETDIKGIMDFSGQAPYLYANGRMVRIKAGTMFAALGGSQEINGEAYVTGTIKSEGTSLKELKANLKGDTAVYSKDGVIKKWKLLSRIFALLNVYDLVSGKIDFGKDGLAYRKLGASFAIDKGVLHTSNFLLDSPSMVITGSGDIDLNKETIEGNLEVSPLVALDRTIDKIPVIRSILKDKNKGFLYVTYTVKGSFDDPDITTNYVGTVGAKSIEILKNILVFPKEVFERK